MHCRGLITTLVCAIWCTLAVGQAQTNDTFTAIPPSEAARYHIDFTRFFASPEAERAQRAKLDSILKELESLKGKTTANAENLDRALRLNDQAQIELARHYAYLYLRNAVDTTDEESLKQSSALDAEVASRTAFLRHELMPLTEGQLAAFVARKPSLAPYVFAIESARRYRPYALSLKEEELLSATAPNNDWAAELYDKLITQPPTTELQRDVLAFTLTRLARARSRLARLHNFPDAASQTYFNSYWTKAGVDNLLGQLAQKADLFKRYQRIRAEHLKTQKPVKPPRFTIDHASEIIRNALQPLGPDYGRELSSLLDPANGRMDIVPGTNRRRGGFSQGFIGTDSVFYSAGFTGSYNDMRVLTHESTHAVQRQLMNHNGVLPAYATGPNYLFEAFAIFNEFLLPDYLYRHATDPELQRFYLESFLEGKGLVMFRVAPEVMVEHAVYEGVENGRIKTADDLDELSQKSFATYWWSDKKDAFKQRWMNIPLMYEDPFYDTNYIYGSLLALNFYDMYLRDAEHFVPRYIALMKSGFGAPPSVLLKRFLDLDINDPGLVANAFRIMEEKVNLLEKNYQGVNKSSTLTPGTVGMITRDFTDDKRKNWQHTAPRPLRTLIWYPTDDGIRKETIFGGPPDKEIFAPVTVAPDVEVSKASKQYPLILLSHGTGGSAIQMMWLGYYLSARGYIVAAVNHHGNTASETQLFPQGFLLYWERAKDLTVVLDKLLADPIFGARIDRNRIGAAGFSLGGYTVISIAGGVFSSQQYDAFCHSPQRDFTCDPQPEFPDAHKLFEELKKTDPVVRDSLSHAGDSYRDERIKRVFAIAPALGSGFTEAGLSKITVPVFIVIGEADKVTPLMTNAQRYANLIKGARLTVLPGDIGHYTFLAECNAHGKAVVDICRDAESVDRATVHQQVAQLAFKFFEQGWTRN